MSAEWKIDENGIRTWGPDPKGWSLTIYPSSPTDVYGEGPHKVCLYTDKDGDLQIEHEVGQGGQYGTYSTESVYVPLTVIEAVLQGIKLAKEATP